MSGRVRLCAVWLQTSASLGSDRFDAKMKDKHYSLLGRWCSHLSKTLVKKNIVVKKIMQKYRRTLLNGQQPSGTHYGCSLFDVYSFDAIAQPIWICIMCFAYDWILSTRIWLSVAPMSPARPIMIIIQLLHTTHYIYETKLPFSIHPSNTEQ